MLRAAAILTLPAWTPSAAGLAPAQAAAIERLLESYRAKGLTDGAVLVARGGVPVFRKAFGLADRERGTANTPETVFRIGSINKQFTALAILQLAAKGALSLDDPISRFIEAAPPAWAKVTVRHLLTHTSGIPNHTSSPEWGAQNWLNRSAEDLVAWMRDRPLESEPGQRFQYDNTGYVILGLIVRKASGRSLGAYLHTHVFAPLGMTHTGFVSERAVPGRATGYVHEGEAWHATEWMSAIRESGAGGMYSTLGDLLKWDQALNAPRRLGLKDLTPMFADYGHGFGLGYVVGKEDGHRRWWHNGHVDGFSAMLARYPDDRLTIIVLSNDDSAPVETLSRELAAACF
jgi:CubicO group peptidase (beta-lactamase class C family)